MTIVIAKHEPKKINIMRARYQFCTIFAILVACVKICEGEVQIGPYVGAAISPAVTDAHGAHVVDQDGTMGDIEVVGMELEQYISLGINCRYYILRSIGIEIDLMYSPSRFPEQFVTLMGNQFPVLQPKSDFHVFAFSLGPLFRYKGSAGFWQKINPYAAVTATVPLGWASDVNMSPEYGQGGASLVNGIGFGLVSGVQHEFRRNLISIEYRYERLYAAISKFRSFEQGLNVTKSSSYIVFGYSHLFGKLKENRIKAPRSYDM